MNRTREIQRISASRLMQRTRAAHFEKPASSRASCPGGNDPRIAAGHVERRKTRAPVFIGTIMLIISCHSGAPVRSAVAIDSRYQHCCLLRRET